MGPPVGPSQAPGSGTLHLHATTLLPLAEALFAAPLNAGFRNLHAVIHHRAGNFAQGMPTDPTDRLAARDADFRHPEATRGPGWWGTLGMQDHSAQRPTGADPFNWIRIYPGFPKGADFPFDHAGIGETALMLALAPDTVDMDRVQDRGQWYTETASQATAGLGENGVQIALAHLRRVVGLAP